MTPRPPIPDIRHRRRVAPRWNVSRVPVHDGTPTPLWVWIAEPYPTPGEPLQYNTTRAYGRRAVAMAEGAVLAATHREALDYVLGRGEPQPLHLLPKFRKWCGYADR